MDFHTPRIKKYCQTDEESVILNLIDHFKVESKFLVDIGAGDGFQLSNTQLLIEQGWQGCRFDVRFENEKLFLRKARVTRENVCFLLEENWVPREFGLLSIDIDGIDIYVLHALLDDFRPSIVVFEFNGCREPESFEVIHYDPNFFHQQKHGDYYGASWGAFQHMFALHDYTLVAHSRSLNGYAVANELGPKEVSRGPARSQYHAYNPDARWADARNEIT